MGHKASNITYLFGGDRFVNGIGVAKVISHFNLIGFAAM